MSAGGILAVLNNVDAGCDRTEYEAWYQRDHMPDRLNVPGFRHARRYRCSQGDGQDYFTFYETDSPDVLRTPLYAERLAAPTPWTRRMMTHFRTMSRSVCHVACDLGGGIAGTAAVLGCNDAIMAEGAAARLAPLLDESGVTRVRLWLAAADVLVNPEAALRPGGDTSYAAILVVEGTLGTVVRDAARAGADALHMAGAETLYRLLYASP